MRDRAISLFVCLGLWLAAATSFAQATASATVPPGHRLIGKLGQAISEAPIRSTASTRARVYYKAKPYQYLVINATSNPDWYSVVLVNGRNGFIRSESVAKLPYNVTVPVNPPRTGASGASRSGSRTSGGTLAGRSESEIQNLIQYSYQYVGTRYVWGGNSLTNGIDCSGFVQQLFGKVGVDLPRTAAEQALVGQPVERLEDLRPGDRLYFWENRRNKIGHTGIFIGFMPDGGAYFIHSSSGRRGVATDDLREAKWRRILVAARR